MLFSTHTYSLNLHLIPSIDLSFSPLTLLVENPLSTVFNLFLLGTFYHFYSFFIPSSTQSNSPFLLYIPPSTASTGPTVPTAPTASIDPLPPQPQTEDLQVAYVNSPSVSRIFNLPEPDGGTPLVDPDKQIDPYIITWIYSSSSVAPSTPDSPGPSSSDLEERYLNHVQAYLNPLRVTVSPLPQVGPNSNVLVLPLSQGPRANTHLLLGVPLSTFFSPISISKQRRMTDWDHPLKHGNVTTYRQLNKAIIQYSCKQDSTMISMSISNLWEALSWLSTKSFEQI